MDKNFQSKEDGDVRRPPLPPARAHAHTRACACLPADWRASARSRARAPAEQACLAPLRRSPRAAPRHKPPAPPSAARDPPTQRPTTGSSGWKGDIHPRGSDGWVWGLALSGGGGPPGRGASTLGPAAPAGRASWLGLGDAACCKQRFVSPRRSFHAPRN
jgi:hypothetical protein